MSSESLDFDEVPLALPDLSHYMELPSYEKSIFTTDEQMAHNDATSYHTTLGDYDFPMSEVSSVLSEPPAKTGLDYEMAPNEDSGVAIDFSGTITPSPWPYGKPIRRSPWQPALSVRDMDDISSVSDSDSDGAEEQFAYEHSDEDDDHMSEQDNSGRLEDFDKIKVDSAVSDFEKLPCEVLSRIACLLPSDVHLTCLILTCHTFARQLQPENSGVWKTRFLQKFDHPIVEGPYEFRIAYQLRAIALPRFADLGFETRDKAKILLLILKDMVLETYHKPQQWHTTPRTSLNIIVFADAMKSNWMVHFLSTRLFARDHKHPYGRQPPNRLFDTLQVVFSYLVLNRSAMAFQVGSDKTDYDLARIYNWDQPFVLLYERLPDLAPESTPPPQSSLFPNLRRETPSPKWRFKLNMNTLLHIRNFWHRHLTEARAMGGEETFVNTAAELAEVGIVPRAWNCPLQEPTPLQTQWYGLYSCLYPWPRCRRQLEDKESEAEVWDSVDPLHLDISSGHAPATAWPQMFSRIPALAKTLTLNSPSTVYLRGLAPFQPPSHLKSPISHPQHLLDPTHYHHYTSLRLRGVLHPIDPQSGIPGWQRIVFVLYKPNLRYLNDVFDYATEYFGEAFEQTLSQLFTAAGLPLTQDEIQKHYAGRLAALLADLKGPVRMTRERIQQMEDRYRDPAAVSWADVEHTYVYEGVLVPGGSVMMGKWWRLGPEGYRVGEGEEFSIGGREGDCERGPFVFWGRLGDSGGLMCLTGETPCATDTVAWDAS